jgi:hypothetical protein
VPEIAEAQTLLAVLAESDEVKAGGLRTGSRLSAPEPAEPVQRYSRPADAHAVLAPDARRLCADGKAD